VSARRRIGAAAVLLAAVLAGGCATELLARAAGAPLPADTRTAQQIAADGQTSAEVRRRLRSAPELRGSDIGVDTYEGVVALHGTVASIAQIAASERLARGARSVVEVRSELVVRSGGP
jgi:hyperosmotically inducible periplasmic protein